MDYYHVSNEDKVKIRETFNVTEEDVKVQINKLREWVKTVPLLPKYSQDEHFLYSTLAKSKFREEVARKYVENYFKGIVKYANMFQNLGKSKPLEELGTCVPSPKLTHLFERVVILKLLTQNKATKTLDVRQLVLDAVTTVTYLYTYDDAASVRVIVDLQGFTMMDMFRMNMGITHIFKLALIVQNTLKLRIAGIEIINAWKLIHALLAIAKMVLRPKLFSRITVHNDIASLMKNIPEEGLPSDYGGECESIEEMLEKWDYTLNSHQSFFETVAKWSEIKFFDKTNK